MNTHTISIKLKPIIVLKILLCLIVILLIQNIIINNIGYCQLIDQKQLKKDGLHAEKWLISSYCSCIKCCGKTDGITASGKPARYGYVACNWLPFGTKVNIEGLGVFVVMDRGAKSQFGSKKNHIKHLDIYLNTHKEARKFGVRYTKVNILKGGE